MKTLSQPDLTTFRLTMEGDRIRFHRNAAWAMEDGVPNEGQPSPEEDNFVDSLNEGRVRVRPQPWKRAEGGGEDELKPCKPGFAFVFSVDYNLSQAVYVQQTGNPVCYYAVPTVGLLLQNGGANPPACGAASTVAIIGFFPASSNTSYPVNFRCWWNQFLPCTGPAPDTSAVTVSNSGTCRMLVNGAPLNPGDPPINIFGIHQVMVGGDQSGFGLGTDITISLS